MIHKNLGSKQKKRQKNIEHDDDKQKDATKMQIRERECEEEEHVKTNKKWTGGILEVWRYCGTTRPIHS